MSAIGERVSSLDRERSRGQKVIIAAFIMIIWGIIMILPCVRMIIIVHDNGSAVGPVP